MSPIQKEFDRPLGQSRKAVARRDGQSSGRRFPFFGAAAALLVVAGSAAIALQGPTLRTPQPVAVSSPEVTGTVAAVEAGKPTALAAAEPSPMPEDLPDSPSVIHVSPPEMSNRGVVVVGDPSTLGQDLRVAHLPERALLEASAAGQLPVRAADGRRPVDVYARPWSGARGARIAIIVGGLGLSQTGTQSAIARLPSEVTLAFAPQGNSLSRWMQDARQRGHEVVMQVPLEPYDYPSVDPGRNTLTVEASPAENVDRLHWSLGRITNYTGVMNYMGARFTADEASMETVMSELGRRGLLYLDDGSSARSVAAQMALKFGVPYAAADATIDSGRDRGAIMKKLDELERIARAKGIAIGTGSAFDTTVDAVATWVAEAKRRGIEIVPVSAVVIDPERG